MENLVRYRCYSCAKLTYEKLEYLTLGPEHNTIVLLCEKCEKRFETEGPFWRKEGTAP